LNALDELLGPLATVECRRAVRPRWLVWVRMAAAVPAAGIVLLVAWAWMLWSRIDPSFLPGELLAIGLVTVEGTQVVLALLASPALIAGAVAGEKDRGTLVLLLTSRLAASDIILGRLTGCFSQVALLSAAGLPSIALLAALRRAGPAEMLLLVGLPAAVAFGAAGLSVAASTLARRGRDALLTVYLIEVLLIVAAFFTSGIAARSLRQLEFANPFAAIYVLVSFGATWPAVIAIVAWLGAGALGTALAIWQLRPAYYRQTGGASRGRRGRRRRVPPISERPMLWKELHIESAGTLGAFGQWLTRLLVALLAGAGCVIFATLAWEYAAGSNFLAPLYENVAYAIGGTSRLVLWLVQWGIGLRAAGVIGSERQRATWDAILTSPLEGREIIMAKTWGSLHALRWLIAATCFAWIAAFVVGGMTLYQFFNCLLLLAAGGAFMAAAGVAVSMSVTSATRGMAVAIGVWMGAALTTAMLAGLLSVVATFVGTFAVGTFVAATSASTPAFNAAGNIMGAIFSISFVASRVGLYLAATAAAVGWIAARFDRLAGRMGGIPLGQRALESLKSLAESPGEPQAQKS
jgi:ABC-type transport system involved in multi-copper enzyme maturation permease subunit